MALLGSNKKIIMPIPPLIWSYVKCVHTLVRSSMGYMHYWKTWVFSQRLTVIVLKLDTVKIIWLSDYTLHAG